MSKKSRLDASPEKARSPQENLALNRLIAATSILASINFNFIYHPIKPKEMRLPKIICDADGTILYELEYDWTMWRLEMEIDEETDAEELLKNEFGPTPKYTDEDLTAMAEIISENHQETENNLRKEDFKSCEKGENYFERLAVATLRFTENVIETFKDDKILQDAVANAYLMTPVNYPLTNFIRENGDADFLRIVEPFRREALSPRARGENPGRSPAPASDTKKRPTSSLSRVSWKPSEPTLP